MTQESVNVLNAALSLPSKERAEVASMLLESLDEDLDQSEIDKAWADEALARLQAYDEGRMEGVPLDEVLRKLRARPAP